MKKDHQTYNETYSIAIIDEERIVTLNRKYLPTFSRETIEGEWSDEYIESLLRASVSVEKNNISKLRVELSKHSTTKPSTIIQKDHNFEFFWIYINHPTPAEMKKIRAKISEILKRYTGLTLEFFE